MRVPTVFLSFLATATPSGTAARYLMSFDAPPYVSAGEPIDMTVIPVPVVTPAPVVTPTQKTPGSVTGILTGLICAGYCGSRGRIV
jgi:hypothetical protein